MSSSIKVEDEKKNNMLRIVWIIVSVLLLVAGFYRDEPVFVMRRAINICLECIGIG